MNNRVLYQGLAFAGALPFVACALALLAGVKSFAPFGALDTLAGSYGLAIVSFLAGTHWAVQLLRFAETPYNLFIASNIIFLAVWFAWVLGSLAWALSIQVVAFVYLLFVDHRLSISGVTSSSYFRVRSTATAAATLSLLTIVLVR